MRNTAPVLALSLISCISSVSQAQTGPMMPLPTYTVTGARQAAAAVADLIDLAGKPVGQARFFQGPRGVLMSLSVTGLSPGAHGVHFHWTGQCDATAKFATANHHMGLKDGPHGFLQGKGPHAGDLPNLIVGADGTGAAEFYTTSVRLNAATDKRKPGVADLFDADDSSLIIHEKEDDAFTQPSGGAGGRIACGVIRRP